MKKIGIIGAGIMAAGMAENYLKAGYEVLMWNRSPERLDHLKNNGANVLDTPKAVTEQSGIIIECVSDDAASQRVWLGTNGILAGASTEKILIASSSLSIEWTDELIALCQKKKFKFLDMPLTGSRAGAENGTLRLLIGGDKDCIDAIRPELETIAEKIYHFGPAGTGMRFKLILNAMMGIHMDAAAQALHIAKQVGIDPETLAHAFVDGTMGPTSPATKLVFDSKNWEPGHVNFAMQWIEKDMRYAQAMLSKYNLEFNLLNDAREDYTHAKDSGLAKEDVTSIRKFFVKRNTTR